MSGSATAHGCLVNCGDTAVLEIAEGISYDLFVSSNRKEYLVLKITK